MSTAAASTTSSLDNTALDKPKFVWLKRQKQSFVVSYNSSDTSVLFLKKQVEKALRDTCRDDQQQAVTCDRMRVYHSDKTSEILEDDVTLQDFPNNQELYLVFQSSVNEWEPIDVVSTNSTTQVMED